MTLDELIDTLQTVRAQCPGAGTATVQVEDWDVRAVAYELGEVQVRLDADDTDLDAPPPDPAPDDFVVVLRRNLSV